MIKEIVTASLQLRVIAH